MKKRIFIASFSLLGISITWNVYNAHQSQYLSDLALINIDAIASGEAPVDYPCKPEKGETCSFDILDGQGNIVERTLPNQIYVEPKS